MINTGSKCRCQKKHKKIFFRKAEPYSRIRASNSKDYGQYKCKCSVPRKKGNGKFPKNTKF